MGHAAIDEELYARDVARLILSEEGNGFGNFVRVSHPSQRHGFRELLFHSDERVTLLQAFHDRSVDVAWADYVHTNFVTAQDMLAHINIRKEQRNE